MHEMQGAFVTVFINLC